MHNHRDTETPRPHREITREIIGACIEVHRQLGPGLLESAYQKCVVLEFRHRGISFESQVPIPIKYRGADIADCYRADLIVEKAVVVELKAVTEVLPVHEAQLLTYLRLTSLRVGLIVNFNVAVLHHGVHRRILGATSESR